MLSDAYESGRNAAISYAETPRRERRTRHRLCPYLAGSELADDWQQGWNDAWIEIYDFLSADY